MQYIFMLIFVIFAVAADQIVKFLVVANIPLGHVAEGNAHLFLRFQQRL